jgi:hypothetical protein
MTRNETFDYSLDYASLDFRAHPELYRMGKGEQGVLMVQPYKDEILPHWRFRTPTIAGASAKAIYRLFRRYRDAGDFVGMDMARKFLQMGITRSRRYANHASGRKYAPGTREKLPLKEDPVKAQSAEVFGIYYRKAKEDPVYLAAILARKTSPSG